LCANLVSNAIKYTLDGRTVTIVVARDDDHVVLYFSDEGIGISAEDQRKLFQEFFRATTSPGRSRVVTAIPDRYRVLVLLASWYGPRLPGRSRTLEC
jgi:signal transduction histidine kinase